jgi:hypothetical protein
MSLLRSPVHVAPAYAGSGKGPTTLDLKYAFFPCISTRGFSMTFEPMTLWLQGNSFITAPRLPFIVKQEKCVIGAFYTSSRSKKF